MPRAMLHRVPHLLTLTSVVGTLAFAACDVAVVDDVADLKTDDARLDPVGKADGQVCDYDWSDWDIECPAAWIGTQDGCDCGCDVVDPDCEAEPEPEPEPEPVTDDPWDPASCAGTPLDNDELAALFSAGETERVLGSTIVQWQSRQCNDVTGCTAWENEGPWLAGVNWSGDAVLSVPSNGFRLEFEGSTHNGGATVGRCTIDDGDVTCQPQNFLGSDHISLDGEMNDGCLRVTGTRRYTIGGNPTNSEYRVALLARFEDAPEPEIPHPLPVDSPFNPDSCTGPLLSQQEVVDLFEPGALSAELGPTNVQWQSRDCNDTTGCTAWTSHGSSFAGVQWAGDARLQVQGSGIRLEMVGRVHGGPTTVARCSINAGDVGCDPRNYLGTDHITLAGEIRDGCVRISGQDVYNVGAQTFGTEYRVGLVAEF